MKRSRLVIKTVEWHDPTRRVGGTGGFNEGAIVLCRSFRQSSAPDRVRPEQHRTEQFGLVLGRSGEENDAIRMPGHERKRKRFDERRRLLRDQVEGDGATFADVATRLVVDRLVKI
jgi:hypothetical protein